MKKFLFITIICLLGILALPRIASAHPGRTASDGCHYCRTNCDKWGVPWNERHCHNGDTSSTKEKDIDNSAIWIIILAVAGIGGYAYYARKK